MKFLKKLAVALLFGVMAVGGCASPHLSQTPAISSIEAFYAYQQKTSVMLCYVVGKITPASVAKPIGTGGVVGKTDDGKLLILTARHCINDLLVQPNYHLVVMNNGKWSEATIISEFMPTFGPRQDFAFITADPSLLTDAEFNRIADRDPVLGERVYVSPMFPWMGVPTTLEGRVASISEDKSLMIIQVQGYFGMSGSNVVSADGEVIGVLIAVSIHGQERTPIGGTSLCVVVRVK